MSAVTLCFFLWNLGSEFYYWILTVILQMPFYPVTDKDIYNMYTNTLNVTGTE